MNVAFVTISRAELLARERELASLAIANEHGRAARSNENFAIIQLINFYLITMVQNHNRTFFQIVQIEHISVHDLRERSARAR